MKPTTVRALAARHAGLALPLLLAALLCGCAGKKTSDRNLAFVTPSEAEALVQGRSRLLGLAGKTAGLWVDPRSEREFREGHIPGAMHLAVEELSERHSSLNDYDVLIVYGDSYNDPVSLAFSKRLIELGHDARTLRGGLRAWEAAGNSLAQGSEPER
jgi:rhodanese-related sulfurtransferase